MSPTELCYTSNRKSAPMFANCKHPVVRRAMNTLTAWNTRVYSPSAVNPPHNALLCPPHNAQRSAVLLILAALTESALATQLGHAEAEDTPTLGPPMLRSPHWLPVRQRVTRTRGSSGLQGAPRLGYITTQQRQRTYLRLSDDGGADSRRYIRLKIVNRSF